MKCIFCGPQVMIEKGQGSCPSCNSTVYKVHECSVNRKLAAAYDSKGVEAKIEETGVSLLAWAKEHAVELYSERSAAEMAFQKEFVEGNKAVALNGFSEDHFKRFCQDMGRYGQLENKIFGAYMKAKIEVVEDVAYVPEWENKPVQGSLEMRG